MLDYNNFKENKDYLAELVCSCGGVGTIYECTDEDGSLPGNFSNSVGTAEIPFTTSQWVTFYQEPFLTSTINGTAFQNQSLFAGLDRINWIRNASNNNPDGEALETFVRTFLVNEDSLRIYGDQNEGSQSVRQRGFGLGNSTSTFDHLTARNAPSGSYHITLVFDVIYKSQFQVAQLIRKTEPFNITSIQDTFTINKVRA